MTLLQISYWKNNNKLRTYWQHGSNDVYLSILVPISTVMTVMKGIYVHNNIISPDFGYSLTVPVAQWAWHFWFWVKCFDNYWVDCWEICYSYQWSVKNTNSMTGGPPDLSLWAIIRLKSQFVQYFDLILYCTVLCWVWAAKCKWWLANNLNKDGEPSKDYLVNVSIM